MLVKLIGLPFPREEKIKNIKALREAYWTGVEPDGRPIYLGLKESKCVIDMFCSDGFANIEACQENIDRMTKIGFKIDGHLDAKMKTLKTALIASRQMVQDALDNDDIAMIEAMLPAYRLSLQRFNSESKDAVITTVPWYKTSREKPADESAFDEPAF